MISQTYISNHNCRNMSLKEIFKSPFKLVYEDSICSWEYHSVRYRTEEIEGNTTLKELYDLSKIYFEEIVEKYKNYNSESIFLVESEITLYVSNNEEYDRFGHTIREFVYDISRQRLLFDIPFFEDEEIKGKFFLAIDVEIKFEEDETEFDSDGEPVDNDREPLPSMEKDYCLQNTSKEFVCSICKKNIPNILYRNCLHIVACSICNPSIRKCPKCNRKINSQRILFS